MDIGKELVLVQNVFDVSLLSELMSVRLLPSDLHDVNYAGDVAYIESDLFDRASESIRKICSFNKINFIRLRRTTIENHSRYKRFVHTDPFCEKVLIISLTKVGFEEYGTCFWYNRATGLKSAQVNDPLMKLKIKLMLERDSNDIEKWELWYKSRLDLNEGLLFNSALFHSPPIKITETRISLEAFLS